MLALFVGAALVEAPARGAAKQRPLGTASRARARAHTPAAEGRLRF